MSDIKFDVKKLERLNNPERFKDIPPKYIWEKVNVRHCDTLVEIGAGTAFFCRAFLKIAKPQKIFACDISQVMLDWIQKFVVAEYPEIIPVKSEESRIPLADEMADVVYMINLHHELAEPDFLVAESYRLLKPGGKIFIVDWKRQEMTEGPPQHIRCLSETVCRQLSAAGFDDVETDSFLAKHFFVTANKPVLAGSNRLS